MYAHSWYVTALKEHKKWASYTKTKERNPKAASPNQTNPAVRMLHNHSATCSR